MRVLGRPARPGQPGDLGDDLALLGLGLAARARRRPGPVGPRHNLGTNSESDSDRLASVWSGLLRRRELGLGSSSAVEDHN
jgi:hypothetical protein